MSEQYKFEYQAAPDSKAVRISPGVEVPNRVTVTGRNEACTLAATLHICAYRPSYNIVLLSIDAWGINTDFIRSVPLDPLISGAHVLANYQDSPDSSSLARAADAYTLAGLRGESTANAVAVELGVSIATAGRLIRQLRTRGMIDSRT